MAELPKFSKNLFSGSEPEPEMPEPIKNAIKNLMAVCEEHGYALVSVTMANPPKEGDK